jgi:hypothetical protein
LRGGLRLAPLSISHRKEPVTLATLTDKERADLLRWIVHSLQLDEAVTTEDMLKNAINVTLDKAWRYEELSR